MAVPKKKTSKSRRDRRRATHSISATPTVACPSCGAPRLSHRACPVCGDYRGRTYPTRLG